MCIPFRYLDTILNDVCVWCSCFPVKIKEMSLYIYHVFLLRYKAIYVYSTHYPEYI